MAPADHPENLHYTAEHEWVGPAGDAEAAADGVLRVGITAYAQEALGDIVFVTLPQEGEDVTAGSPCGEIESTKSVSDLYAPVTGTVTAVNASLDTGPEKVNTDPYGEGWIFEVRPAEGAEASVLMDAATYAAQLD